GMARDVTEQKKAERLARQASELNQQIIASASEGVAVYDHTLRCLAWNPQMERLTGVSAQTAIGESTVELVRATGSPHLASALQAATQGEVTTLDDMKLGLKNERWISCRAGPLRNSQNEITGVIVMLHDVTERHRTENRLQEYEKVVESLDEMI